MSDQSLRDALEKLIQERRDYLTRFDVQRVLDEDRWGAKPALDAWQGDEAWAAAERAEGGQITEPVCLGDGVCTNPRCPRHSIKPAPGSCSCPPHPNPAIDGPGDWDPNCMVHQPDRQPSDAAVEAAMTAHWEARRSENDGGPKGRVGVWMHAALVAAYRVDAPRPLLDREAVSEALLAKWIVLSELKVEATPVEHSRSLADAVMELARPMPTREQIAEAMHNHWSETHTWRQGCSEGTCIAIFLDRADALLALLNGDES